VKSEKCGLFGFEVRNRKLIKKKKIYIRVTVKSRTEEEAQGERDETKTRQRARSHRARKRRGGNTCLKPISESASKMEPRTEAGAEGNREFCEWRGREGGWRIHTEKLAGCQRQEGGGQEKNTDRGTQKKTKEQQIRRKT